jgi:hypothetical protein
MWGLDLSGTKQGAGGVGGLLAVKNEATVQTHFVLTTAMEMSSVWLMAMMVSFRPNTSMAPLAN